MTGFIDNPAIRGRETRFTERVLAPAAVVAAWRSSLFAFEWLKPDGGLKSLDELTDANRAKRLAVEDAIRAGRSLAKPVLGIGITEGIEIGAGREILLTLAGLSHAAIPVHLPTSCLDDFDRLLR
jgi:hypothetical protein